MQLFDYVAECVDDFLNYLRTKITGLELLPLGFTFSFPVQQKGLNIGIMMKWTKGFDVSGVVGRDVVQLLREAFQRRKVGIIGTENSLQVMIIYVLQL